MKHTFWSQAGGAVYAGPSTLQGLSLRFEEVAHSFSGSGLRGDRLLGTTRTICFPGIDNSPVFLHWLRKPEIHRLDDALFGKKQIVRLAWSLRSQIDFALKRNAS